MESVDWEDRLDDWELELELGARLDGSDWVTLEKASAETGVSRAALRTWYRSGQIPSRLVDGPHGPQRLVPLAMVAERAEASPRVRKTAERRLSDEAQLELLRHRVDQLELRLAELERRLNPSDGDCRTRFARDSQLPSFGRIFSLNLAEETVTRVAEPRHDVALFVEPVIDRARDHPHVVAWKCLFEPGQALGRGEQADRGDRLAPRSRSMEMTVTSVPPVASIGSRTNTSRPSSRFGSRFA